MADLSQLMQVAPTTGAFFTGQKFASDQQQDLLRQHELAQTIAKMQQDFAFNEQNNPLKLENSRLTNQGLGITNETNSLANQFTQRTQPGKIAATNATSAGTVSKEHIEQAKRLTDVFTRGAYEVANMPEMQRTARLMEVAKMNGLDPNDETVRQFVQLGTANPQQLIAVQNKIREDIAKHSTEMAVAREGTNRSVQVANIHEAGATARNDANINAGKFNRTKIVTNQAQFLKENDPVKKVSLARQFAVEALTNNDMDEFRKWKFMEESLMPLAQAKLNAAPKPGTPDLNAMSDGRVPVNPSVDIRAPNLPPSGGRQQPTSVTPNDTARISQSLQGRTVGEIKQAFPIYANIPDEQLRERIKQKFGVDLK